MLSQLHGCLSMDRLDRPNSSILLMSFKDKVNKVSTYNLHLRDHSLVTLIISLALLALL